MTELGQLEAEHKEFEKRKVTVVAVSIEDKDDAAKTQAELPHLVVVADASRNLSEALKLIHRESNPAGGDTAAPTTILVDGSGTVRWLFRPSRVLHRLSPAEVLAAVDEHLQNK